MDIPPHLFLEKEFRLRREKNAAYSLRAFSKHLRISSGRVSQLLSRKRKFTPAVGKKIAGELGLDPKAAASFLKSIEASRRPLEAVHKETESSSQFKILEMDVFESVADPLHFSILSLLELDDFVANPKTVGKKLRVTIPESRAALERLERLGLLSFRDEIYSLRSKEDRATLTDVSSSAIRKFHGKILEESKSSLHIIPVELRDITSITMAIDKKKIPEAKERIKKFRREMSKFLESGEKNEVYRINIQLVPVTGGEKE